MVMRQEQLNKDLINCLIKLYRLILDNQVFIAFTDIKLTFYVFNVCFLFLAHLS